MYSSGIKNAVSTLGTTLSEMQLKKMWNYSDIPYVCLMEMMQDRMLQRK